MAENITSEKTVVERWYDKLQDFFKLLKERIVVEVSVKRPGQADLHSQNAFASIDKNPHTQIPTHTHTHTHTHTS